MTHNDMDNLLRRAADTPHSIDPAILDRIKKAVGPSPAPVRPLAPAGVLAARLLLACAVAALAVAAGLGLHGIHVLSAVQIAVVFPALGILAFIAAFSTAGAMTPGSALPIRSGWMPAIGCTAIAGVFAVLFHDYRVDRFVPSGVVCLTAGLADAALAAVAGVVILRRGFAVNAVAAGVAIGTLAGLAGVAMLELHCANLQAWHILVWHTGVLAASAAIGALAWLIRDRVAAGRGLREWKRR